MRAKIPCSKCGKLITKKSPPPKTCRQCYMGRKCTSYPILNDKEWIRKKYFDEKLSFESIGKIVGCNATSVRLHFKNHGFKSRPAPYTGLTKGSLNPSWKGGVVEPKNGYRFIHLSLTPFLEHHNLRNNYYIAEHVLNMELFLGRMLSKKETVHHKNGIKKDNRIENLQLFSNTSEHRIYEEKINSFAKLLLWGNLPINNRNELLTLFQDFLSKSE